VAIQEVDMSLSSKWLLPPATSHQGIKFGDRAGGDTSKGGNSLRGIEGGTVPSQNILVDFSIWNPITKKAEP
jgi:hypothetical protein